VRENINALRTDLGNRIAQLGLDVQTSQQTLTQQQINMDQCQQTCTETATSVTALQARVTQIAATAESRHNELVRQRQPQVSLRSRRALLRLPQLLSRDTMNLSVGWLRSRPGLSGRKLKLRATHWYWTPLQVRVLRMMHQRRHPQ